MLSKYKNPKSKIQTGFTLVEALVASAVFMVIVVMAIDLFLLFLRGPFSQIDAKHVEEQLTYIFEEFGYHIRTSTIDYSRYPSITNPMSELYIIDAQGQPEKVFLGDGVTTNLGQIYIVSDLGTFPFTTDATTDIYVDTLEFYIYPSSDPAAVTVTSAVNAQAAVVMFISAHSVSDPAITQAAQSLVTLRYYVR